MFDKWENIKLKVRKDVVFLIFSILVGVYYTFKAVNDTQLLYIFVWVLFLWGVIEVVLKPWKFPKYIRRMIGVGLYFIPTCFIGYGISKFLNSSLPNIIFDYNSTYIVLGIAILGMLIYLDFFKSKKDKGKK